MYLSQNIFYNLQYWLYQKVANTKIARKFRVVNLDLFCESYGKNHKRSPYQKVDLFIFIIEYFTNTLRIHFYIFSMC